MFAWWGRTVYRYRYIVIGVMIALCVGGGIFGASLGKYVTQSGFYDDGSESVKASVLGDDTYGRDRTSHVVATFTAPEGTSVSDPKWSADVRKQLDRFQKDHPKQVLKWVGAFTARASADPDTPPEMPLMSGMSNGQHAFVSIWLQGDKDDTILNNYRAETGGVGPDLQKLNGGNVELAGLLPITDALTGTIATDEKRMEVLALPLVAVVLFFVFGGVIAAGLPVMVGGLSILGATGILRLITVFHVPVHFFAQPVVSLIGLGLAIDYGLFVLSRFREELAEGYDTEAAVRRSVMTAGRTVTFSAVLIIVSSASLLVLPQGFVKSLAYAIFAAVGLAALLSITLLPACLGVLGSHVDALGVRTLFRVPFLRNWSLSNRIITWFAEKTQKTKTREEVEGEFWGRLVNFVMKRPLAFAIPIAVAMILLIIPLGKLSFGGMSEKYLPPNNPTRIAQEHFDTRFPGFRTEKLTLVIKSDNPDTAVPEHQVKEIANKAAEISGFTDSTWGERPCPDLPDYPCVDGHPKNDSVRVIQNGLVNRDDAANKIRELRAISAPKGLSVWVGGTPALEQDSIHSLVVKFPMMLVILISSTMVLMFLAFGSLVLPLKAAVMSALTLGSTLGILTWIFVDGHFTGVLNFTPTKLMVVIIALVVAVGYGLATDYEVFLVSRMVEARESGMSTTEAIRIGTATTGRLITAAALVLAVVAGSFVFSELVMMKYLAFGLMAALLLDATVVRMFLVPSVMKLLGDDCWWAPRWMKRLQSRIGLGEIRLPDERKRRPTRRPAATLVGAGAAGRKPPPSPDPTHPKGAPRSRTAGSTAPSDVGTNRMRARKARQTEPAEPTTTRLRAPKEPTEPTTARLRAPKEPTEPETTRFAAPKRPTTRQAKGSTTEPAAPSSKSPPRRRKPTQDREIESWLGELRTETEGGTGAGTRRRASRRPGPESPARETPAGDGVDTTKIPAQQPEGDDSAAATEKLKAQGRTANGNPDDPPKKPRARRGGGLSAQELLRREGRI